MGLTGVHATQDVWPGSGCTKPGSHLVHLSATGASPVTSMARTVAFVVQLHHSSVLWFTTCTVCVPASSACVKLVKPRVLK